MNRLISYYQKELAFLKNHGKAFAEQYPKIARRLGFNDGTSEDPHVERLLESFALLTSRIHQRLDDDMPELTEALLTSVAPQFLRSKPSTCIVEIEPDRNHSSITEKSIIPAGVPLYTRKITDAVCNFQTIYPVTLLPLNIEKANIFFSDDDLLWHLGMKFKVWSGGKVEGEHLRLFLHGQSNIVNIIYTLMCSEVNKITLSQEGKIYELRKSDISTVGFEQSDLFIMDDPRVAPIHTLLQNYFFFPNMFHFIDLKLPYEFNAKGNSVFDVEITFNRMHLTHMLEKLVKTIDAQFFRLNCTPAVNIFSQRAEPIALSENTAEYPIIVDHRKRHAISVWAINNVSIQRKQGDTVITMPVQPLLGIDYSRNEGACDIFWQSFIRGSGNTTNPYSMFIAFSDRNNSNSKLSTLDLISINLSCTNHNLPNLMVNGHPEGDFESDLPIPALKIRALSKPTRSVAPPVKGEMLWRLVSLLSLNYTLINGHEGAKVLREQLKLYNWNDNPSITKMINLISCVDIEPIVLRIIKNDPQSLARGISITLTFSDEALNEPEYFLMCCFIERYLALHAPVNSFTKVRTKIEHEEHTLRHWPVRAGKLAWI